MKGHKTRRGANTWRLFADAPAGPNGKRKQRTRTFHGSARAADAALRAFVDEIEQGRDLQNKRTLGALCEQWYAHMQAGWEPGTRDGYRRKLDLHVIPYLGEVELAQLGPQMLDAHYRHLAREGHTRRRRNDEGVVVVTHEPLAARTVGHVHRIIHTACEQGRRWGWLTRNPAEFATPPRAEIPDEKDLGPERVARLIDMADDDLADIAVLASATGAREGELAGLRWSDFDWDRREVDFARRAVRVSGGPVIRPSTKTRKDRTVGLDERTLAWMKRRRVRLAARALACGMSLRDDAYVFSDHVDGTAVPSPARIAQRWSRHKTRLGINVRFHDLRHFHIALALDEGKALARVSRRAGHARESTTSDIYDHVMRADDHDIAEAVAARLTLRAR